MQSQPSETQNGNDSALASQQDEPWAIRKITAGAMILLKRHLGWLEQFAEKHGALSDENGAPS